ncbi:hypothetical protein [Demequina maris]|uniref:hypothetical protein n=1 Tax=Demequina maris TaxID=1638982 RepID=UPI00078172BB|nr:hypothetical protein [Demequina maris]
MNTLHAPGAHNLLVYIDPVPGTWSGADSAFVHSLDAAVSSCGSTSWELTGSHLDAEATYRLLVDEFGAHARVVCLDLDAVATSTALVSALRL